MSRVVVVGSLNCDLVVRAARRPLPGETLTGESFQVFVGGKGNNQAIAASRAGAMVSMVGRIGEDGFGDMIVQKLAAAGVDGKFVSRDPERSTGVADIFVDASGQNSIVVVPEANGRLAREHVDVAHAALHTAKVVLLQLEIPIATVTYAAAQAKAAGAMVVLNPAPALPSLPHDLVSAVDLFVPNQIEAQQITGIDASTVAGGKAAASALLAIGYPSVVITMGSEGAIFADAHTPPEHAAGHAVAVIDSTAAGDAFCGAMAAGLAEGRSLGEAVRIGNAAGALACTKLGAEPSLPSRAEIDRLLAG
jgi:ribokinase